jgi:hypothetical protein
MNELIQSGRLPLAVAFQLTRPLVRLALQTSMTSPVTGATPGSAAACPAHLQRWHPFSRDVLDAIAAAAPAEGGWPSTVSLEFFSLFWSLSMYDLTLPKAR